MVERFERNKLYINSNVQNRIVKCEFITNSGAAVLTHVCKNPGYTGDPHFFRGTDDILSASPENWDEFTLPETPGTTLWLVSFLADSGRRAIVDRTYETEREAVAYTNRPLVPEETRLRRNYGVHSIVINPRMTLEQFVRHVEELEETV